VTRFLQAAATVNRVEALLAFGDRVAEVVRENRIKGTGRSLATDLVANPVVTPTIVAAKYDVSYPAASNAVTRLVDAGLLHEITGRKYDRVFASIEVIRIAES